MKIIVLICGLITVIAGQAQNYIKRTAEEPVFDVEVIVFGQNLAQPPVDSIQQADIYDQQTAAEVNFLPADGDWPVIKKPPQEITEQSPESGTNLSQKPADNSQWEIPLNEEPINYEVLVWYLKSKQLIGSVVNLLDDNPKYKPLIRQIWRQPATPFSGPLYVKVNNHHQEETDPIPENTQSTTTEMIDFSFTQEPRPEIDDFRLDGQVALSQGRFTHLHIKFNYYRINPENEVLIYGSKQQRQIKINEWQYFDHPQFGVLIKVTAVKAEELL